MDMWVFGYGSLLRNPGFEYVRTALESLDGYQRSFCKRSIYHRGTTEHPGLVLALDQKAGVNCNGLAFRVSKSADATTLAYLRERKLISAVYLEKSSPSPCARGRGFRHWPMSLIPITSIIEARFLWSSRPKLLPLQKEA